MTKVKRGVEESEGAPERSGAPKLTYKEMRWNLNPIAQPLASRRLTQLYKCIKKHIRRGVKEVQKFLNKEGKGIMVWAGDTLPIDVYCYLPIMCEDLSMPYAHVPSKTDLGAAAGSKRPICVIMIKPHEDYQAAYDDCLEEVESLPVPL